MATGKRNKKSTAGTYFGKGATVICKAEGSTHEGESGEIVTGEPNKEGEFEVRFVGDDGRTLYSHIHGNDLALPEEMGGNITVSVNGGAAKKLSQAFKDPILGNGPDRDYSISKAKIKDDFCHYSFEIRNGQGKGEEHNVKVDNVITDHMKQAFERLNVHLAVIDDVYKHAGLDISDIDTLHNHELTMIYFVTGFEVQGEEGSETVKLIGSKHLSTFHGRMDITTPKVPLDNLSSYKWYNELKSAIEVCRNEVALYKEGKYMAEEEEDTKAKSKQMTIGDAIAEAGASAADEAQGDDPDAAESKNAAADNGGGMGEDFEAAKL